MHGLPTEALVAYLLWIAMSIAVLGIAFAALTLVVRRHCGDRVEMLSGAAVVLILSCILSSFDVLDLEGHFAWRMLLLASVQGAGYFAARAILSARPGSDPKRAVVMEPRPS